jgi:hypothetical protein
MVSCMKIMELISMSRSNEDSKAQKRAPRTPSPISLKQNRGDSCVANNHDLKPSSTITRDGAHCDRKYSFCLKHTPIRQFRATSWHFPGSSFGYQQDWSPWLRLSFHRWLSRRGEHHWSVRARYLELSKAVTELSRRWRKYIRFYNGLDFHTSCLCGAYNCGDSAGSRVILVARKSEAVNIDIWARSRWYRLQECSGNPSLGSPSSTSRSLCFTSLD